MDVRKLLNGRVASVSLALTFPAVDSFLRLVKEVPPPLAESHRGTIRRSL